MRVAATFSSNSDHDAITTSTVAVTKLRNLRTRCRVDVWEVKMYAFVLHMSLLFLSLLSSLSFISDFISFFLLSVYSLSFSLSSPLSSPSLSRLCVYAHIRALTFMGMDGFTLLIVPKPLSRSRSVVRRFSKRALFQSACGVEHPNTCTHVKRLGPCFEPVRKRPKASSASAATARR